MTTPKFHSIEDYLASLDPIKSRTLRSILDLILATFPDLEAKIAWNVPVVHRGKDYVAGVAAYKRHLTFSPWSVAVMEAFKADGRLDGLVVFKNCFQVPVDWAVDVELVRDLVGARMAELGE